MVVTQWPGRRQHSQWPPRNVSLNYSGSKLMFDASGGNVASGVNTGSLRSFQMENPLVVTGRVFAADFEEAEQRGYGG